MKLTKAQKILLDEVNSQDCQFVRCHERYKPAQKLVELGLVNSKKCKYGFIELTRLCDND